MNKKTYVQPATEFIDIELVNMLAVSGNQSIEITNEAADNNYDALSNARRGSWGNRWE